MASYRIKGTGHTDTGSLAELLEALLDVRHVGLDVVD